MRAPLLTVVVTAFEQERFIGEALTSVLEQRTREPFEIVVGVDASADGTATVVRTFEERHSRSIRALYHQRRIGLFENFRKTYETAEGRYIALLEGDDYWTDAQKLQKQLDCLERSPETVLCGHLVAQLAEDGRHLGSIPEQPLGEWPARREFVERLCDFHTSSLLFRNVFANGLPRAVFDERTRVFDLPLKLALAARGEIAYIPEPMSVFRRVHGSASSGFDGEMWRDVVVRALLGARDDFGFELRRVVDRQLAELEASGALSPRQRRSARVRLAVRALRHDPAAAWRVLSRGVYSGLPENLKRIYRGSRTFVRRPAGEGRH